MKISTNKIYALLVIVLFSFGACSDNEPGTDKPSTEEPSAEEPSTVNEMDYTDTDELSSTDDAPPVGDLDYSRSFEVSLPENLRALTQDAYEIYGIKPSIRFSVNEGNRLDTYWEGASRHLIRISIGTKSIVTEIPFPQEANQANTTFLGYEYLGKNNFIMGTSDVNGDDIQRKRPMYYCFGRTGKVKYALDLWASPPDPSDTHAAGRSGQGLVVYNKEINNFGVYLARRGMGSHQAAWLSFHDAETGKETFVRSWYISHNFDQRLLPLKDGRYLASAHADDLPSRGLLIERWSFNSSSTDRTWSNAFPFPKSATANYNITNSATGDILELPNGNIAVLYTTQHVFTANDLRRDLRLSIFSNVGEGKGSAVKVKDVWLTSYEGTNSTAGWGAQMAHYADGKIFVAWNVFDLSSTRKVLNSSIAILDYNGAVLSKKEIALPNGSGDNMRLVQPSQIIRKTNDGKYLVFMSEGSAPNMLRVNLVGINK